MRVRPKQREGSRTQEANSRRILETLGFGICRFARTEDFRDLDAREKDDDFDRDFAFQTFYSDSSRRDMGTIEITLKSHTSYVIGRCGRDGLIARM